MRYKRLGLTELVVSRVSLGTVALGMAYGVEMPGESKSPSKDEAIRLIQKALEGGINFFDTAPGYGKSEEILGEALGNSPSAYIATKVNCNINGDDSKIQGAIRTSIEKSLKLLKRDTIDLLQIHNATTNILKRKAVMDTLFALKEEGLARYLGASLYTTDEALTAIGTGVLDAIQVAYNVFDQRMDKTVFKKAQVMGVGVITRSAYLKGVLTQRCDWLPKELDLLRKKAHELAATFEVTLNELPDIALRFCLSNEAISTTLIGPKTVEELERALDAEELGPLPSKDLDLLKGLSMEDPWLLNPSNWPLS